MALPKSCAFCKMHKPGDLCVLNAPSTTTVQMQVAKWPKRESTSVCAKGSVDKEPTKCFDCVYWWSPNGKPLPDKVSTRTGIWATGDERKERRMYCAYDTASPEADSKMYYPRVTYETDGCGTGKAMEIGWLGEDAEG